MHEFIYKDEIIFYQIDEAMTNCTIFDSYRINSKEFMFSFIKYLRLNYSNFLKRSELSYVREWISHNWLYKNKVFIKSTKDTDLCINEPFWRRIGYYIISKIYRIK